MTLILAAVTNHFAVLASDRRIQWSRTVDGVRKVTEEEDSDTKSCIIDRRFVMGFAGLGRIFAPGESIEQSRGWRVEGWLTDALANVPSGRHFDVIAEKFGPVCEAAKFNRHHAFVAVGFDGEVKTPCMVTVRNDQFAHTFTAATQYLHGEPCLLRAYGERVPDGVESYAALRNSCATSTGGILSSLGRSIAGS